MRNALVALQIMSCCLFLGAQAVLTSAAPARSPADYPPGFYDGDPLPARTAYLTFDDGPCEFTGEILDALERESVKATFFVCARWAEENWLPRASSLEVYAESLKRMYAAGHVVGSHGAAHRNFAWTDSAGILRDLRENAMLMEWAIGLGYPRMTLVRPPYGSPWWREGDAAAMGRVAKALSPNAVVAMWNDAGDTRDSDGYAEGEWYTKAKTDRSAAQFRRKVDRIAQRVSDVADGKGVVILMHDTHPTSLAALPRVIALLRQRGYSFATMEDWVRWRYGVSSAELINARDSKLSLAARPARP